MITHTQPLQDALEIGMQYLPSSSVSECLTQLAIEGANAVRDRKKATREQWRAKVVAASGRLTGVYGDNYLEELREGWPE